jgi:hypothetical protein
MRASKDDMKAPTLFFALFLAVGAAQAKPFKDLCDTLEPLRRLEGLKYVKPEIKVDPKAPGVKPQDVVFTIEAKAGAIKVSPGADGLIELPLNDKLCAENPNYVTNQPAGTLNLGISIDPAIPPVRTFDYRLLESLRAEYKEAIARQNLMYRLIAPSSKGYEIVFEAGKGGSAEIRLPSGPRKLTANEKGIVRIPFDDAWVAANPAIELSEVPKKIGLAFD